MYFCTVMCTVQAHGTMLLLLALSIGLGWGPGNWGSTCVSSTEYESHAGYEKLYHPCSDGGHCALIVTQISSKYLAVANVYTCPNMTANIPVPSFNQSPTTDDTFSAIGARCRSRHCTDTVFLGQPHNRSNDQSQLTPTSLGSLLPSCWKVAISALSAQSDRQDRQSHRAGSNSSTHALSLLHSTFPMFHETFFLQQISRMHRHPFTKLCRYTSYLRPSAYP